MQVAPVELWGRQFCVWLKGTPLITARMVYVPLIVSTSPSITRFCHVKLGPGAANPSCSMDFFFCVLMVDKLLPGEISPIILSCQQTVHYLTIPSFPIWLGGESSRHELFEGEWRFVHRASHLEVNVTDFDSCPESAWCTKIACKTCSILFAWLFRSEVFLISVSGISYHECWSPYRTVTVVPIVRAGCPQVPRRPAVPAWKSFPGFWRETRKSSPRTICLRG